MNDIINYTELAKDWLATNNPTLNETQQTQFLMFCKMYKLNPWKNEAYAILFHDKNSGLDRLTLVTSYLVICARAMTNPKFYRYVLEYWQMGKKLEAPAITPNMKGVVIRVNIYDKENNLISNNDFNLDENALANYSTFKKDRYQSWAEKCAITNALRRTFPLEVSGLHIPEEMPKEETNPVQAETKHPKIAPSYVECKKYLKEKISDRTEQAKILGEFANMEKKTKEDLENGNFEPTKFKAFVDGYAEDGNEQ